MILGFDSTSTLSCPASAFLFFNILLTIWIFFYNFYTSDQYQWARHNLAINWS